MKRLPFRPEFEEAIRSGVKTMTSRTRRYGRVGDVLDTPFGPVRLVRVDRLPLVDVACDRFGDEGFGTPVAFTEAWARIHPRKGFVPNQLVWVHEFELVKT